MLWHTTFSLGEAEMEGKGQECFDCDEAKALKIGWAANSSTDPQKETRKRGGGEITFWLMVIDASLSIVASSSAPGEKEKKVAGAWKSQISLRRHWSKGNPASHQAGDRKTELFRKKKKECGERKGGREGEEESRLRKKASFGYPKLPLLKKGRPWSPEAGAHPI